jgi:hypothetical protein
MSLAMIQILAGAFFVVSLLAGVWLVLHLTSLAAAFEGYADLVPAEARPRHSRARLVTAMILLLGGALACLMLAFLVAGIPAG